MKAGGPLQNLQLGTLKEADCRKRYTFCGGQGVLHIVYGSRVAERIQCYLQCFVALQDGSAAETFKWVVFKETTRKHKNHEDSEVFWGRQDAVSEGPKPLNGSGSFKLCKKLFLKNKQGKTSIPMTAQFVGATKK